MQTISLSKPNFDLLIVNLLEHTDSLQTVIDIVYLASFSNFKTYNEVAQHVIDVNNAILEQQEASQRAFYSSNNIAMSV